MNYNHLHYFYVVVREGSISAASRHLRISQPSLSSQIKTFEANLGVSLFERRGNRLELTPLGKTVYSNAAQMFEISSSITEDLSQSTQQHIPIKLGLADEIERPFAVSLAKFLFKRQGKEPPVLSFSTGLNDALISKLRGWAVDAVITNRPNSFDDLEIAGTLTMPVCFAVAKSLHSENRSALHCPAKDIGKVIATLGLRLAVPSGRLKLREETDEFLSRNHLRLPVVFESDTLTMIVRAILDGVGVGFVPLPYISREVARREITVFGSPDGLWKHTLFLMIKRGRGNVLGVGAISQAFDDLENEVSGQLSKIEFRKRLQK